VTAEARVAVPRKPGCERREGAAWVLERTSVTGPRAESGRGRHEPRVAAEGRMREAVNSATEIVGTITNLEIGAPPGKHK
jgi:hypothetical protein